MEKIEKCDGRFRRTPSVAERGMSESSKQNGFTLAEILVVIAIVSILGIVIVTIFTNTLRGSNKSQILAAIKQNGQSVLETMDKTVRGADNVVCYINDPSNPLSTLVVVKNGIYTRYRFIPPTESTNGLIQQDFPVQPPPPAGASDIKVFIQNVCTDPQVSPQILTDTNPKTGVSVVSAIFQPSGESGSKAAVTVKLELAPGKQAPQVIAGQIDPVTFKTTIQLR